MTKTFASEDADRLLQLADQFLTDWEEDDGKDETERADCKERRTEWDAIRPLLVAAPDMLEALQRARNFYGDGYDAEDETETRVMNAIDAALAKAKPGTGGRASVLPLLSQGVHRYEKHFPSRYPARHQSARGQGPHRLGGRERRTGRLRKHWNAVDRDRRTIRRGHKHQCYRSLLEARITTKLTGRDDRSAPVQRLVGR